MTRPRELRFAVPDAGEVSALMLAPEAPRAAMALAHGAGAGMRHPFMTSLAQALAAHGMATLRYQFPYVELRRSRPDPQPVLLATVRAAVATLAREAGDVALFAAGKSMGGRMTTLAAAEEPLANVRGIVLFGFPLHAMGKPPGVERAAHLAQVTVPLLFLQGTRDTLADLGLMREVCDRLGPRATLHVVEGGDHSFHVLKKSGRDDAQALAELASETWRWAEPLLARGRAGARR